MKKSSPQLGFYLIPQQKTSNPKFGHLVAQIHQPTTRPSSSMESWLINGQNHGLSRGVILTTYKSWDDPPDPRLHACVRSSELCSSPLSTAFALLTADGTVYAWGHPETMAARKRWIQRRKQRWNLLGFHIEVLCRKNSVGSYLLVI